MTSDFDATEARLRMALTEAALQVRVSPPVWVPLSPGQAHRDRLRRVGVSLAAVAAVVALLFGALTLHDSSGRQVTTTPRRPVQVSPDTLLGGEADVTVYMRVDATATEVTDVLEHVRQSPEVRAFAFVGRDVAYRIFRKQVGPTLSKNIDPNMLPISFQIRTQSCAARQPLARRLASLPGVQNAYWGIGLSHADAKRFDLRSPQSLPAHGLRGRCGERLERPRSTVTSTTAARQ